MSQPTWLATLFSSRGRPRASAAAPLLPSLALLLPIALVPGLLLPAILALRTARHAALASDRPLPAPAVASLDWPHGLPSAFTPEVARWASHIQRWSAESGLPPEVIATVMQIESCGDPMARSSAGAQGLFQVMPFHFAEGEDPADPEVNARRGLRYLARSMQLAGDDLSAGFAGYNGGHAVIVRHPDEWPAETRRYARWAVGILQEARGQGTPGETLQAWLQAGGDHLCRQAATGHSPRDA